MGINEEAARLRAMQTESRTAALAQWNSEQQKRLEAEKAAIAGRKLLTQFVEWAEKNHVQPTHKGLFGKKTWILLDQQTIEGLAKSPTQRRISVTNKGDIEIFNANWDMARSAVVEAVAKHGYPWDYPDIT